MIKEKSMPPILMSMILSKLGLYCSERLSVDLYYLNEAINLLLPTFDINEVKIEFDKIYGEGKFEEVSIKRKKLGKRISETKNFYDAISDKSLVKKFSIKNTIGELESKIQKIFRNLFYNNSIWINAVQQDIYNLFVFLIYNSSVRMRNIPNEYFKNLEQSNMRKIHINKEKTIGGVQ
jgi:hypothetical protein